MTTIRDQIKSAIFGQESGSGRADTSLPNDSGARGDMQITKPTFDGLKTKGLIPSDWDWANPAHSHEAGNRLIDYLSDKYNDDPAKVAAAYYAGEKAVTPDGKIINFHDLKHPNAPDTYGYANSILTRMGLTQEAADEGGGPVPYSDAGVIPRATDFDVKARPLPPRAPRLASTLAIQPVVTGNPLITNDNGGEAATLPYSIAQRDEQAVEQRRLDTSMMDSARAGYMHQGISGIILRNIAENHDFPPQAGFDPRVQGKDFYENKTDEEQRFLDDARSHDQLAYMNELVHNRRADMETVAAGGGTQAFVSQLIGGLPEGYLTGLGAAKAAWLAGRAGFIETATSRAGKLAMSAAENTAANVGSVAVQQQLDPYVGASDYPMAFGMSVLGTVLHLPSIFGKDKTLVDTATAMQKDAADQHLQLQQEATANVGGDAPEEAVKAEMGRIEANRIAKGIDSNSAPLPPDRQFPGREMFEGDATEKNADVADQEAQAKEDAQKPATDAPPPTPPTVERQLNDKPEAATPDMGFDLGGGPRGIHDTEAPRWDGSFGDETNRRNLAKSQTWKDEIAKNAEGITLDAADAAPHGVSALPGIAADTKFRPAIEALTKIAKQFLPDAKITVGLQSAEKTSNGVVMSFGKTHIIGLNPNLAPTEALHVAMHEFGHAIFHQVAKDIPSELLNWMRDEHGIFIDKLRQGKPSARLMRLREGDAKAFDENGNIGKALPDTPYSASFDEYTAEAFVRYLQKAARGEGTEAARTIDLPKGVIGLIRSVWEKVKAFYDKARKLGYLQDEEAFPEFFDRVLQNRLNPSEADMSVSHGELSPEEFAAHFPQDAAAGLDSDPLARKYGFDLMPRTTVAQRARANMVHMMYKTADNAKAAWNNIDAARLKVLTDNKLFNVASTDVTLLKSQNPLARMVAAELLEDPTGASGRRSTAALAKYLNESKYLGNTLNDIQSLYTRWRGMNGGSALQDFFNGDHYRRFNLAVAEEIERRKMGLPPRQPNEHVNAAADSLEKAYERIRQAQIDSKTLGWAALPESSVGYMPHRMSPEKIRNMTNEQMRALHSALVDQFIQRSEYDPTFAANLASQYIEKVRSRGLGGYDTPIDIYHAGAGDVVEDALNSMGMQRDQIRAVLDKYLRGAANHTKSRLNLNLLAEHEGGFRLIDLFETDQTKLLRSQASRVSGEVALARHGIMGKPGLALIRDALQFGESGKKVTNKELEAFDQIAAEFLGAPFGDAGGPWLNRAMQANSLARLGGMGFTQAAEYINAAAHIGVGHTLSAVGSFGRLRAEAIALAKGEHVENGILGSIETMGGREFGAEAYKMNFPFAEESTQYGTFGKDTPNMADKLLRGGMALQGKLSFWRAIHAAQQRGLAEQVVLKAARFIREGGEDKALADMGITPDVAARLKADINNIAPADGSGNTVKFDITKATDKAAAEEFVQAVHRGVGQMIQQSFIGETGKWAHNGLMRLMLQFRTFSLISVEKQWARQVGNHGTAAAFGILMGSMAAAAPIYMLRTALAAVGRPDRDAYLERQLSPQMIARATLNYVAMSGLAGDFMDAFTTVSGVGGGGTGGRANAGQDFFGNTVAPSVGLVNDVYKAVQNTKSGTDPTALLKTLPFGRLPWLIPAINGLTPEPASSSTGR